MPSSEKANAQQNGIVQNEGPSPPEGSEGQNDDVMISISLRRGRQADHHEWHCGVKIHTNLYCQYYQREIVNNNTKCKQYQTHRPIFNTIRATKKNGYKEHREQLISCSTCINSINHGLRFKKI